MSKKNPIEIAPEMIRTLATRQALGTSIKKLEEEFGYSRFTLNRALNTDLAKEVKKGILEDAVKGAVMSIRTRLADMTSLAMEALEENLKEHSMDAVRTYFRALGVETQEQEKSNQAQSITVVLPGQTAPKFIDKDSGVEIEDLK